MSQILSQANSLELRVVGKLQHFRVRQAMNDLLRDLLAGCQIDDLYLSHVHGIAKEQDLKVRAVRIPIHTCLRKVYR